MSTFLEILRLETEKAQQRIAEEVEKPDGSKVLVQLGGEVKLRVGAGEILGPSIEAFEGDKFGLAFKTENEKGTSVGYVCNDVLVDLQVPERLFYTDNKVKPLSDRSISLG